MRRLIVPISFAVMALAIAAMLPALVSADTASLSKDGEAVSCYILDANMGIGAHGDEVENLTAILVREGILQSKTRSFDEEVANAVAIFQSNHGIPPTGYVGPMTMAAINSLNGCGISKVMTNQEICPNGSICEQIGFVASMSSDQGSKQCDSSRGCESQNHFEKMNVTKERRSVSDTVADISYGALSLSSPVVVSFFDG